MRLWLVLLNGIVATFLPKIFSITISPVGFICVSPMFLSLVRNFTFIFSYISLSVMNFRSSAFSTNSSPICIKIGVPDAKLANAAVPDCAKSLSEIKNISTLYSPLVTSFGTVIVYFNFTFLFGSSVNVSFSTVTHFDAE